MAYSGRCILSKWFTDRSANLGDCTQPCRWQYHIKNSTLALEETERPDNFFPIEEDQHGTYIMNSKDLCLLEHLGALARAGVTSFKIEGRAKSLYYVANTVKVYRAAIDDVLKNKKFNKKLLDEIQKTPNRGFTTGFLLGEKNVEQRFDSSHDSCDYEFCGEVRKYDSKKRLITVRVHNSLKVGDQVEILDPKQQNIELKIKNILNKKNESLNEAHGGQKLEVFIPVTSEITAGALLRRRK
jgi:putative protease